MDELIIIFLLVMGYIGIIYALTRWLDNPKYYKDLERIKPLFGSKHLGIIFSASWKFCVCVALLVLGLGAKGLVNEITHKTLTPSPATLMRQYAEEGLRRSYSSEYVNQYTSYQLEDYRRFCNYITTLSSQPDFNEFNDWLIKKNNAKGVTQEQFEANILKTVQRNGSYSAAQRVIEDWYYSFRREKYKGR
ncbi:MAG: hypothetical protein IJS28_07220 [Synergistaceae bacterium]|nr:hypothetical protein [Synergistaceae bacterium]